jgi:hypothetical protein
MHAASNSRSSPPSPATDAGSAFIMRSTAGQKAFPSESRPSVFASRSVSSRSGPMASGCGMDAGRPSFSRHSAPGGGT